MLLVGFGLDDTMENVKKMAYKIANLRIFPDSDDKLNLSILDVKGSILSISQFTLYANTLKGHRPSFSYALKDGAKEVVLTGIHLSSFGIDRVNANYENDGAIDIARESLLSLMKKIAEIDGVERIRLGSLEPRIINDYFLKFIVNANKNVGVNDNVGMMTSRLDVGASYASPLSGKFCANFCLSLQSGCDKTLKSMNRHYTAKDFENACDLIRKYLPDATITTDVIVGFPGETEEDFLESLSFVKRMRFYNPNIFPYSRRKGTVADKMDNQITFAEKHRRAKIMIEECERISKEIERDYYKTNHDVLVEEIIEENGKKYGVGYTKEYVKMKIELE